MFGRRRLTRPSAHTTSPPSTLFLQRRMRQATSVELLLCSPTGRSTGPIEPLGDTLDACAALGMSRSPSGILTGAHYVLEISRTVCSGLPLIMVIIPSW